MSQRRRFNVSEYISTLNAVDEPESSSYSSSSSNYISDDLAAFSNANFFDFDLGCSTDLSTTVDQLFLEQEQLIDDSKSHNAELVDLGLSETTHYLENFITANHHHHYHHGLGPFTHTERTNSIITHSNANNYFHHSDSKVQSDCLPARKASGTPTPEPMLTQATQTYQSHTINLPSPQPVNNNNTNNNTNNNSQSFNISCDTYVSEAHAAFSLSQPQQIEEGEAATVPQHPQQEQTYNNKDLTYNIDPTLTSNNINKQQWNKTSETGISKKIITTQGVEDETENETENPRNKKQGPGSQKTLDDEKRRRNTAASARFRIKKRLKQEQMEKHTEALRIKANTLEVKARQLELENIWLKSLVMNK